MGTEEINNKIMELKDEIKTLEKDVIAAYKRELAEIGVVPGSHVLVGSCDAIFIGIKKDYEERWVAQVVRFSENVHRRSFDTFPCAIENIKLKEPIC